MLGAVTAAKAAAGSRTLVRLAALLALTTVCRAGQDGRPAPPRSGSGCSRRSAAPRRCLRPGTRLRHKLHNTTPCIHRTLHTAPPDTLCWWHLCWPGFHSAATVARLPWWPHGPELLQWRARPRLSPALPRPAPGLVTGAAADVNTPLPRPLTTISWTRCWAAAACLGQHMWSRSEPTQYMLYLLYIIHVVYMLYAGHN